MKKILTCLLLGLGFALMFPEDTYAQEHPADSTYGVLVRTIDGNQFTGNVVFEDSTSLKLETENFGIMTIQRRAIREIKPLSDLRHKNGRYWFESPHTTRYFATSNAYGIPQGTGYYDNGWLFFNQVSYGFSDHFSLGVGFAPLIILDGPVPVWFTPKVTIPLKKDKLNFALGGLLGRSFSMYEYERATFAAAFSQLTVGPPDANFSVGFGLSSADGEWATAPIYSLAGMIRTGPKFALLSENYFLVADGDRFTMLSLGVRFMGRKIAIDAGILAPVIEDDGIYPVPWAGLHVPFGKGRKKAK